MSGESLECLTLLPQNYTPFKIFAKLNGNHVLMANIFKLHAQYQTFHVMNMHNINKI